MKNIVNKITILLILLFFIGQIDAQKVNRRDSSTGVTISENKQDKSFDFERKASFEDRIDYLTNNMRSYPEKIKIEGELMLEEVIALKDLRKEAIVLNILCRSNFLLGNLSEAMSYGSLSLERFNESGEIDLHIRVDINSNLAAIYRETGDFTQALDFYMKSLKIVDTIDDPKQRGILLGNIGNIYLDIEKREKAISYYKKAIDLFQPISYKMGMAINNNNIGAAWFQLEDYDNALHHYQIASALYDSLDDIRGIALINNNIGFSYKRKGLTSLALPYLKKSLELQRELGAEIGFVKSLSNLGSIYTELGDYDSAVYYLDSAQVIAVAIGSLKVLELNAAYYTELYVAQGKDKEALHWFRKHKVFSDSSLSAQSNRLLTEMNTKYETTQKEKEISLLRKENEIHALEKAKDEQFYFFVILSLLFVVILIYAVFSIRNSKNAKKMTEFERIALRAQMKPHFIFNALSSIQTFVLESDVKNADRYISKFARLIRMILETSKMNTILLEDELQMLRLYMDIEKMRLEDKFDYSIEVNPSINTKGVLISSMLLQPFIENAIWHGISPKDGKGKLLISVEQDESCIKCMIEDDGVGRIHASEQNKLPGHKSMGMDITQKRLSLLHRKKRLKKQHFVVEDIMKSGLAAGTRIIICIPFETNLYD